MDNKSGWQGGEQLSFFFLSYWNAEALYALSFQNGSSIHETKRSSGNQEFRYAVYYDVNPCKGHLVQF